MTTSAQVFKGKIIHWDDEKGFGFIRDTKLQHELFFHISAVSDKRVRPAKGCRVTYSIASGANKNKNSKVTEKELRAGSVSVKRLVFYKSRAFQAFMLSLLFMMGVALLCWQKYLADLVLMAYLLMSAATYFAYARDKAAARQQQQRISELKLHVMSFLFGWPGANAAQQTLRHKTQKKSFRISFYASVIFNVTFIAYLLHPKGQWINQWLQQFSFYEVYKLVMSLFA